MAYHQLNEILPKDLTNIIMLYSNGMMIPKFEAITQLNDLRNYLLDISMICNCVNIKPTEAIEEDYGYCDMCCSNDEDYQAFFYINKFKYQDFDNIY